jgi:hypothetical protein
MVVGREEWLPPAPFLIANRGKRDVAHPRSASGSPSYRAYTGGEKSASNLRSDPRTLDWRWLQFAVPKADSQTSMRLLQMQPELSALHACRPVFGFLGMKRGSQICAGPDPG